MHISWKSQWVFNIAAFCPGVHIMSTTTKKPNEKNSIQLTLRLWLYGQHIAFIYSMKKKPNFSHHVWHTVRGRSVLRDSLLHIFLSLTSFPLCKHQQRVGYWNSCAQVSNTRWKLSSALDTNHRLKIPDLGVRMLILTQVFIGNTSGASAGFFRCRRWFSNQGLFGGSRSIRSSFYSPFMRYYGAVFSDSLWWWEGRMQLFGFRLRRSGSGGFTLKCVWRLRMWACWLRG